MNEQPKPPNWGEFEQRSAEPADPGIALVFMRLFASGDGHVAMKWLRSQTKDKVYGPSASDSALRHLEGQRALVHRIEALVEQGRRAQAREAK
jgi:hypothetical protein